MDGGAQYATVLGVAKSHTQLSGFTSLQTQLSVYKQRMEEYFKQHHRVTINKIQSASTGQMTWFLQQINYKPMGDKGDRGKAQKKNLKRPKKHVVNYNE